MSEKTITVLTPTYNRAYLLDHLYKSIASQTSHNFVWLIVDDGSTDNTKEKVQGYIKEGLVPIKYVYQKNSGKYVAHNTGVKLCNTELIVCVDSDDVLYPQAIEKTIEFWIKIKDDADIAGIVSPRDMNGQSFFTDPPERSSLMDLYNTGKLVGETMLVYRTSILRKYLFPEVAGENFMSECVIYNQIDQKYLLAIQDEFLYKSEYQDDGLTRNIEKIRWRNPRTTLIMYRAVAAFEKNFFKATKSYGCYLAWRKIRELSDFKQYSVKLSIKLAGFFLKYHYIKLFKAQEETLE